MSRRKQKSKQGRERDAAPQASAAVIVPDSQPRLDTKRTALCLAVILAVAALTYSNIFENRFTNWDDDKNVYENRYIREISLENLRAYFTEPLIGMYTPLVYLSYAVDFRVNQLNSHAYHATNLLLHLINITLLFFLMILVLEEMEAAAAVALIFAVHPLNVGAVTPVSVRSSLMYSLFYLGALIPYVRYVEEGGHERKYLLGAGILFLLSLLSKSAAVVFPLLMLLTDYYYGRKIDGKAILEKIPFFALSLFFGILTIIFRADAQHLGSHYSFTPFDRVFLVAYALIFYIVKLFLPINLSAYYPYPDKAGGFLPFEYYLALPILLIAVWGILKSGKYRKLLVFGSLFFLIHIALVLKVLPLGDEMVCDRYAYIPMVGPLMAAAGVFYRERNRLLPGKPYLVRTLWLLLAVCAALFAWMSYHRNPVWKDNFTLYNDIIGRFQNVPSIYNNRGIAFWRKGAFPEALADFDRAISLDSLTEEYYSNRGNVKKDLRDYEGAVQDYNKAITLNAGFAPAYGARGDLKKNLKDYEGALRDYTKAITVKREYSVAYYGRASVYLLMGDFNAALKDLNKALELDPYRGGLAYYTRAYVYLIKKDFDAALRDYDKALEFDPAHVDALLNRGYVKYLRNDSAGAIEDYSRVLRLAPSRHDAYQNRGMLKWLLNDHAGACADWTEAVRLGRKEAEDLVAHYCRQVK